MDRIDAMRIFVAAADAGAFVEAARRLRIAAPSVTRAIAALEERLEIPLFERTTRSVRLTDAGRSFLPECRRALEALHHAEAVAAGTRDEARGELSVTAPATFGRMFVKPPPKDASRAVPFVTSGPVGLHTGFNVRIRFMRNLGIVIGPEVAVQFPDVLLNIDIPLGVEAAF